MSPYPIGWDHSRELDEGDKACGDLILDLKLFFQPLQPGERVCLTATDPAAPVDITAWCRITGHKLVAWEHPYYLIERRPN